MATQSVPARPTGSPMTLRMWCIQLEKLGRAVESGDRFSQLVIAARLRRVVAEGGPR